MGTQRLVVGRDEELATLTDFVAGSAPARAMAVTGAPGIGKSTLWNHVLSEAVGRGQRVLSTAPAQFEQSLPYGGLGDLIGDAVGPVLPRLAPPRRRALEVVLLLADPDDRPLEARAVSLGVRDALTLLAEDGPLVVAVDDVQWLDAETDIALGYAQRRTGGCGVRYLFTRRVVADRDVRSVDTAGPAGAAKTADAGAQRLRLGPLSVGALHRILQHELGRPWPRQTLVRLHETSGGNPFVALQLARMLEGDPDPLSPLPVPADLDVLVRARICALPAPARIALAMVAAAGTPAEHLLDRAGCPRGGLDSAVHSGLLERTSGTVRFTHPWYASAVYGGLPERRLQAVHRRLADVVDDPLARARHLARAQSGPDEAVARTLERAVADASARAAPALAAELAELAVRMTPADRLVDAIRRTVAAAAAQQAAGEWPRARQLLNDLLLVVPSGSLRAEALLALAGLGSVQDSIPLLESALDESAGDARLTGRILVELGLATRFRSGFRTAAMLVERAVALADELGDDHLRATATSRLAWFGVNAGVSGASREARVALDLAMVLDDEPARRLGVQALTTCLQVTGELDAGRVILEREQRLWMDRDELWLIDVLMDRAWLELTGGCWEAASAYASQAMELGSLYGVEAPQDLVIRAMLLLYQGHLEDAVQLSTRALCMAEVQLGLQPPMHLAVIGTAGVWQRQPGRGVELLGRATSQAATLQWGEPTNRWWVPELVDGLVELGRTGEALAPLQEWEADADRLGRRTVHGNALRSRGVIAAAAGRTDEALGLLERSLETLDAAGDPFGAARALVSMGVVRRRARQLRAAREALLQARARFQDLGAASWAERVTEELGRLSGRRRVAGLTVAEQRVAELVAQGRSNKEVAAALFLSERTVASHLTHIYAKLQVGSRTQLARVLG